MSQTPGAAMGSPQRQPPSPRFNNSSLNNERETRANPQLAVRARRRFTIAQPRKSRPPARNACGLPSCGTRKIRVPKRGKRADRSANEPRNRLKPDRKAAPQLPPPSLRRHLLPRLRRNPTLALQFDRHCCQWVGLVACVQPGWKDDRKKSPATDPTISSRSGAQSPFVVPRTNRRNFPTATGTSKNQTPKSIRPGDREGYGRPESAHARADRAAQEEITRCDGSRIEDSNKRNGTAEIVADLDLQGELVPSRCRAGRGSTNRGRGCKGRNGKAKATRLTMPWNKQASAPLSSKTPVAPPVIVWTNRIMKRLGGD